MHVTNFIEDWFDIFECFFGCFLTSRSTVGHKIGWMARCWWIGGDCDVHCVSTFRLDFTIEIH